MRRGQHDWLPESDRPQGLHWHNTRETAQRLHGCRARSSYRQSLLLDGTEVAPNREVSVKSVPTNLPTP